MKPAAWNTVVGLLLATFVPGAIAISTPDSIFHAIASSEFFAQLPTCSQACVVQLLDDPACSGREMECLCGNLFSDSAASCLEGDCFPRDFLSTMNMTATACHKPPRKEAHDSLTILAAVLGSISVLCIILRLMSRPPTKNKWLDMTDDWVMIVNVVFVIVFTAIGLALPQNGFGRDFYTLTAESRTVVLKLMYTHEITFVIVASLTRISILCFYLRIFPFVVLPWLMKAVYVGFAVAAAAGFSLMTPLVFQCTPVSYVWDWWWTTPEAGRCINLHALAVSNGAISLALDLTIMFLPLPELWKLRLPPKKKAAVFAIFAVWGIVVIEKVPPMVSMSRFANSTNPTWQDLSPAFWSSFEAYVSVISACVPRIYMLFSRVYHRRCSSSPPSEASSQLSTFNSDRSVYERNVSSLATPPPARVSYGSRSTEKADKRIPQISSIPTADSVDDANHV